MWSTVKQGVPVCNLWHLNEISSIKKKVNIQKNSKNFYLLSYLWLLKA